MPATINGLSLKRIVGYQNELRCRSGRLLKCTPPYRKHQAGMAEVPIWWSHDRYLAEFLTQVLAAAAPMAAAPPAKSPGAPPGSATMGQEGMTVDRWAPPPAPKTQWNDHGLLCCLPGARRYCQSGDPGARRLWGTKNTAERAISMIPYPTVWPL